MSNNLSVLMGIVKTVRLASPLAARVFYDTTQIMQNKPNLQNDEISVSAYITRDYENLRLYLRRKNKPNQTQFWLCNSPALAAKWLAKYILLCLPDVLSVVSLAKTEVSRRRVPSAAKIINIYSAAKLLFVIFFNTMAQKISQLRSILERLYKKYNHRNLIPPDPLQFVYKYKTKADREIAALLAASLSYGRVEQIEKDLIKLFSIMGKSPYEFTISFNQAKRKSLENFKHRFNTGSDVSDLIEILKTVLKKFGSIEKAFLTGYRKEDKNIIPALTIFCERLYRLYENHFGRPVSKGFQFLLSSPSNGSVCKRLNMFLRWMVRSDDVDLGLWKSIDKNKLIVPVDTHIARLCKILGLYKRKTVSLAAAIEITESFKKIEPADPVKYDFCLSRIGIIENCTGKSRKECKSCELLPFCKKS